MFFYLTPSQIALLKSLFSKLVPKKVESGVGGAAALYGGRPMRPEHFQKITDQFHHHPGSEVPWRSGGGLMQNNWSGQEQFFDLSSQAHGKSGKNLDLVFFNFLKKL